MPKDGQNQQLLMTSRSREPLNIQVPETEFNNKFISNHQLFVFDYYIDQSNFKWRLFDKKSAHRHTQQNQKFKFIMLLSLLLCCIFKTSSSPSLTSKCIEMNKVKK